MVWHCELGVHTTEAQQACSPLASVAHLEIHFYGGQRLANSAIESMGPLAKQLWEVTALTLLPYGLPTTSLMALLAASLILA